MRAWREKALGANAAWVPTLIRVAGDNIMAWTGITMGLRLVTHLGVRSTVRLLSAFGTLSRNSDVTSTPTRSGLSRKGFLKIATGLGAAAGVILASGSSALAGSDPQAEPDRWVEANKDKLPTDYASFSEQPIPYRRAIYRRLPVATQQKLWSDHLNQYGRAHPDLTGEQRRVLSQAAAVIASAAFAQPHPQLTTKLDSLSTAAITAFGKAEAGAIFATLGPITADKIAPQGIQCSCATASDYCGDPYRCFSANCDHTGGCGFLWSYTCNGLCYHQ